MEYKFDISQYIDMLHPKKFRQAMGQAAKTDDPRLTFMNVLLATLISSAAGMVYVALLLKQAEFYSQYYPQGGLDAALLSMQQLFFTPLGIVVNFVTSIFLFYFSVSLLYYICRALGGNGKMGNHLHAMSVFTVASSVVYSIFMLMMSLPFILCLGAVLLVAFMAYALYLAYNLLRAIHPALDMWRTIAAIVGYLAVMAALSLAWEWFSKMIFG